MTTKTLTAAGEWAESYYYAPERCETKGKRLTHIIAAAQAEAREYERDRIEARLRTKAHEVKLSACNDRAEVVDQDTWLRYGAWLDATDEIRKMKP